jgi:hypothetical protein
LGTISGDKKVMKNKEKIAEGAIFTNWIRYGRPQRTIEVVALVESVRVPYVIDEVEYKRRVEERDSKRAEEKSRQVRMKAERSATYGKKK